MNVVIERNGNEIQFFHRFHPEKSFGEKEIAFIGKYIDTNMPFHAGLNGHGQAEVREWLREHCQHRWTFSFATVWFESDIDGTHYRLRWN